ncbi:serine hydrolase domain-containing protein [Leptospira ryugenii]|nr:serine hydrolase domain-containing protein [Leptospira ryugenii]
MLARLLIIFLVLLCYQCGEDSIGSLSEGVKTKISKKLKQENFQGVVLIAHENEILMRETIYQKRGDQPQHLYRKHSFPLGESSKIFTTYAIKILLLEKSISESAYVSSFLPWFPYPKVRIEDLLRHTSGLPKLLEIDPNFDSPSNQNKVPIQKRLQDAKIPTSFVPGEYWKYTRIDYYILSLLIEKISGKSYADYLKEKIFLPLKMYKTFVDKRDPLPGNSGVYSNPEDLVLWQMEILSPTLLFNKQANSIFEKTVLTDAVAQDQIFFGEGIYVGDYFYWTYGKSKTISNLIYHDRNSKFFICLIDTWGSSKGELSSHKSFITETIFGARNLRIREPVTQNTEISLEEVMKEQNVPAVSIAVYKNFQLSWKKNFGIKNLDTKEKVTERTLFRAGSLSKTTLAFTVAQLMDQGLLDPYENWNHTLKKFRVNLKERKKGEIVNLDSLLSHTSGLTEKGNWDDPVNRGKKHIKEIKDTFADSSSNGLKLYYSPGSKSRYSGGGYAVIQETLSTRFRSPFSQLIDQYVAKPLQWRDSTFQQNLKTPMDFCDGHGTNGEVLEQKSFITPELSSGGLWTTSSEIGNLFLEVAKAYNGQSTILSAESAKYLLSPKMSAANLTVHALVGRGFFLNQTGDSEYFFHGGHTKGHKALAFFNAKKGYGIVILTNSENGSNLIWRILRTVSTQEKWDKFVN